MSRDRLARVANELSIYLDDAYLRLTRDERAAIDTTVRLLVQDEAKTAKAST